MNIRIADWLVITLGIQMAAMVPQAFSADGKPARRNDSDSEALFNGSVIPRLAVEVDAAGMATLSNYHQVWGQARPERIDVSATVREGGRVYTNVALHLKGSYTFQAINEKPSLTLNFDKFVEDQRFRGLDKIHLNNSVQDPSYLCEKLARGMFLDAGVPASRIGHARVSLNGRDLGFYVLVEGYNKPFLKRHFESVKGNLYDGGSGGDINRSLEVDSGADPTNRTDLRALAAAAREVNPTLRYTRVEKLVDANRFRTFAALEVLLLHWDGYSLGPNNFRLFRDTTTDKFVFMPHGLDQILGRGMSLTTSLSPKWDGLVARSLFKTPEGRRRYLEQARETFTNHFNVSRLTARLDTMLAAIVKADVLKPSELESMTSSVTDLKQRLRQRAEFVAREIANPPSPIRVEAATPVSITGWQVSRPMRTGVSGRSTHTDGRVHLQIAVTGGKWSSGSWRKTLLLSAGRYEFSGMGRTTGLGANPTNGIVLRLSGDTGIGGVTNSTEWVKLRREFEVPGEVEEELVCEFRGPEGSGDFDLSTLKLRRLPAVANRTE